MDMSRRDALIYGGASATSLALSAGVLRKIKPARERLVGFYRASAVWTDA